MRKNCTFEGADPEKKRRTAAKSLTSKAFDYITESQGWSEKLAHA